jgi:hypothetical protein
MVGLMETWQLVDLIVLDVIVFLTVFASVPWKRS